VANIQFVNPRKTLNVFVKHHKGFIKH